MGGRGIAISLAPRHWSWRAKGTPWRGAACCHTGKPCKSHEKTQEIREISMTARLQSGFFLSFFDLKVPFMLFAAVENPWFVI